MDGSMEGCVERGIDGWKEWWMEVWRDEEIEEQGNGGTSGWRDQEDGGVEVGIER